MDFTGRTVISPDPNCGIDEVMIPMLIAKNLTYPEMVNQHNMEKLKQLVKNGPEQHPGANFVESQDGNKVLLQYANRRKVAEECKEEFNRAVDHFAFMTREEEDEVNS